MRDKSKQLTVINTGKRKDGSATYGAGASGGGKNTIGRDSFVQGGSVADIEEFSKYFLSKVKADTAGAVIDFMVGLKVAGALISKVLKTTSTDRTTDDNVMTSARIIQEIDEAIKNLDDRFLFKIKPDETPFHIGLKGGLTTTDVTSTDYIKGQSGWAVRKNDSMEWTGEFEHVVARILGDMYDLVVQNHAVFKKSLSSEEFISGFLSGKGWAIRMKEYENSAGVKEQRSVAEFDDVIIRGVLRVFEFVVSQMLGENDNRTFTGMMEVDHYDPKTGRVWFDTQDGKLYNPFRKDDVILVQQYNGMPDEGNDHYITKQYELIITEAGIGNMGDGEERQDWVTFKNFKSPMEGYSEDLIKKGDTFVRIDNLFNPNRKGIIQMMTVGEDTPYMDVIYGRKTDPEHALKSRFGNLQGIYNHLFGWLKDFGAYISNLYAVGEFRIAHTGEDVADKIEMLRGSFRTNFKQSYFDLTDEDNFLTNASFSGDLSAWIMGESDTDFLLVGGLPVYANRNMLTCDSKYAGVSAYNDRLMMLVRNSYIRQLNSYIKKPGKHKEYIPMTGSESEPSFEKKDVLDTTYLYMRFFCEEDGVLEVGFEENGNRVASFPYTDVEVKKSIVQQELRVDGKWDGKGDFVIRTTGGIFIDMLVLSNKPLENLVITTETWIEQDAGRIALLGRRIAQNGDELTNLGIELNAEKERIDLYVDKTDELQSTTTNLGVRLDGAEGNIKLHADRINLLEGTTTTLGIKLDAAEKSIELTAAETTNHKGRLDRVDGKLGVIETSMAQIRVDVDGISQTVVSVQGGVDDAKELANKAQTSANDAAQKAIAANNAANAANTAAENAQARADLAYSDAGDAWWKAYYAQEDAEANRQTLAQHASTIETHDQYISLWSGSFNAEGQLITESGLVISDRLNSLYTRMGDAEAEISTSVQFDPNTKEIVSNVKITADVVDINNGVLEIKKDSAHIGGFDINNASMTSGNPNSGTMMLTPAVLGFKQTNGLHVLIGPDAAPAVSGSEVGLYAKAPLGNFSIWSIGGSKFCARYNSEQVVIGGLSLTYNEGDTFSNPKNSPSGVSEAWTDFLVMSSNASLPNPRICKGKILFVRFKGRRTLYGTIIPRNSGTAVTSVDHKDKSVFYISDGNYWYEFFCYHN